MFFSHLVYVIKISIFIFLIVGVQKANSQGSVSPYKKILDQASTDKLSEKVYWHKLVHYKPSKHFFSRDEIKSALKSETFFLANNGRSDPRAELNATVLALLASSSTIENNSHAQCRFPARFIWLKRQLPQLALMAPKVNCAEFTAWAYNQQVTSVSLFFATGYLDNPASYYGHILMRLNTEGEISAGLLETSMDYGAIIPDNENTMVYIIKGLFGGYDAGFTHQKFFHQNHNYGAIQLRDLWEYKLALNEQQVEMIVAHSWELLGNKFTYYFLRNNCAYAMAEMIELVTDQSLFNRKIPWVVPQSIFHSLSEYDGDQALVKEVSKHPSLQTKIYNKYKMLNSVEKQFVDDFSRQKVGFLDTSYLEMSEQKKKRILSVLLFYYQYRLIADPDNLTLKKQKRLILIQQLERKEEPRMLGADEGTVDYNSPDKAQRPTALRASAVYNSKFNEGLSIQFRPAYFDELSADISRPANSKLVMGNMEFTTFGDSIQITRIDIVDIKAMGTSVTNLPGDGGKMWSLNLGVRQQNLACKKCLSAGIEGGVGKSFKLNSLGVYYGLINGRLQSSYQDMGFLSLTPEVGFISAEHHNWKMQMSIGYRDFVASGEQDGVVFEMEHRVGSGRIWDIRTSYEYNKASQLKLTISRYF